MAQDDMFDGTTYIQHGKDHAITQTPSKASQEDNAPRVDAPTPNTAESDAVSKRLAALENELATFKKLVEKRLKSLEKHQNKYLSPEERVYSIQEDS